ncbi:trypsin-like serine peptidase [Arthrobacter sp. R4-81]
MNRSRSLATSLLSLSAAALLVISAGGAATAAPAAVDEGGSSGVTSKAVNASGAAEYWTAERMRNAIPGDVLANKAVARGNKSSADTVERGSSTKISGQAAPSKPSLHTDEAPVSHIGKVFFTLPSGNYVCSGNSVASANGSTVSTAGHCLNEGPGAFATNFVFVPAYLNGAEPYGRFAATSLHTPTQWSSAGDMQYDTGFAVVAPVNGKTLADTVGASGVEFNAPRGLSYTSYGYPAAKPFDGTSLVSCTGTASDDPFNPQFNSQGISCDMTGGSSGGPWFIGSGSGGVQNSVNSYGYGKKYPIMYGPYWGSVIRQAYSDASSAR